MANIQSSKGLMNRKANSLLQTEFLSLPPLKKCDMRPLHMVDTKSQYYKIKKEIDEAVIGVLESSRFIGGDGEIGLLLILPFIMEASIVFPVPTELMRCKLR